MSTGAAAAVQASAGQDSIVRGEKPQHTMWKKRIYSYANFIFHTQHITSGSGQITVSAPVRFKVDIAGDMLGRTFLRVVLPPASSVCTSASGFLALDSTADFFYYVNTVGYAMINTASIDLGNSKCQVLSGRFMDIYEELSTPPHRRMDECVGRFQKESQLIQAAQAQQVLLVNLPFWYTKQPESYIPLGALQLHDVNISIQFHNVDKWVVNRGSPSAIPAATGTILSNTNIGVLVEIVYIDETQRKTFALNPHTYLIEQVQEEESNLTTTSDPSKYVQQGLTLQHNHMAKAFIWVIQQDSAVTDDGVYTKQGVGVNDPFDYCAPDGGESAVDWEMRLNNNPINEAQIIPAIYYRVATATRGWACIPRRNIYSYPVGFNCQDLQINATIQMSRQDNQFVRFKTRCTGSHKIYWFTYNYNILVLSGGMGGIPFAS